MYIGLSSDKRFVWPGCSIDWREQEKDGIRDALTRYTTAVSGAYYFVPSVEALRRFASADD